jgi:hypothetical protein
MAQGVERWMVDYEHGDGEPQHAVLSWSSDDPTTALPEVGTELVRRSDYEKLETRQRTLRQSIAEVEAERDAIKMDPQAERILAAKDGKILELEAVIRSTEAERDQAHNQERQRIQEALNPVVQRLERIRDVDEQTSDGALGSLARHALDDLAALDTLDPSGEEGEEGADLEATLDDMASAIGQAPFIGPNQGREPDETAYERARALREREPRIIPLAATDTSKEEGDGAR